jgi:adenosylhomocysteine nucleosidase
MTSQTVPARARSQGPVLLLYALPEEARPPQGFYLDVAISGAGARNAARTTADLLGAHREGVPFLLICGFAGGLQESLAPGAIVVADRVLDATGAFDPDISIYRPDSALLRAAESVRLSESSVRVGSLITRERVLITPTEKRACAAETQAIAVDMETAGAAHVAQACNIPWLAVRVVTDGVDYAMPLDFNALADADGHVDRGRVARAVLTHPWKIPALIRLGKNSSLATRNLAMFLKTFLQTLPENTP